MTCKRLTPKGHAKKFVQNFVELRKQAVINIYMLVGEEALKIARLNHRYKRRTGNLTSSVGYCILDNGKVLVKSQFIPLEGKDGQKGDKGAKKGRDFLNRLINKHYSGLVFIMVAGMNYASYVEAMSLDVLESAELFAKRQLPNICKRLKLK